MRKMISSGVRMLTRRVRDEQDEDDEQMTPSESSVYLCR